MSPARPTIGVLLDATAVPLEGLAEHIDRFELQCADLLLVGDHVGQSPEPFVLLAALASLSTARIGTHVLCTPLRHPVQTARLALTLAGIAPGRFRLGIGAGWRASDFAAIGLDPGGPERHRMFVEYLSILEDLLEGKPVDRSGNFYACRTVDPVGPGSGAPPADLPQLSIAAAGPMMLRLAAERADVVALTPNLDDRDGIHASTDITLAGLETKLRVLDDARGHAARSLLVPIVRFGDTERLCGTLGRATGTDPVELVRSPFVMVGTERTIVERIRELSVSHGIAEFVFPERALRRCPGLLAALVGV